MPGQLGSHYSRPWWDDPAERERMWGSGGQEAPVVVSGMEASRMAPMTSQRPQARPQRPQETPQGNGRYVWPTGQNNALAFLAPPEGGYQWGAMPEGVRPDYQFQPMNTGQGNALAYTVPTEGSYEFGAMPEDRDRVVQAYQQYGPYGAAQILGMPIEAVMSMVG